MIILFDDIEKDLWRTAVQNALLTVKDVSSKDDKDAIKFATIVADGIILAYRKRIKTDGV